MKLSDTIILSLCVALFIIGVHQVMVNGLGAAYWILMLSVSLLILYRMRRLKREAAEKEATSPNKKKGRAKPRKK